MITAHFYKMGRAAADSRSKSNRIAMLTRQRRAMGSAIGKHCSSSSCSLAMGNAFLLDGRRPFSFSGKKMGVASRGTCAALTFAPVRKRKNSLSRKRISPFPASPARCRGTYCPRQRRRTYFSSAALILASSSSSSWRYATLPTRVLGISSLNSMSYGMAYFATFLRQ